MRNPLKKIFRQQAPESKDPTVYATSLFAETKSMTGDVQYHCLVARKRTDGRWDVGEQTMYGGLEGSAGGISGGGVLQTPVAVDGGTAFEMLKRYENTRSAPGSGFTPNDTFKWAENFVGMADVAKQARLDAATSAGGMAMKLAARRRQNSPGSKRFA